MVASSTKKQISQGKQHIPVLSWAVQAMTGSQILLPRVKGWVVITSLPGAQVDHAC